MACTETNFKFSSSLPNGTELLTLHMNGFLLSEIKIAVLKVGKRIFLS
jgi:hypothetical protein